MSKLTKQVSAPSILQEAAGAESALVSVSGDSFSSDTTVPVYSGDRLALYVGEADRNLENDPQLHQPRVETSLNLENSHKSEVLLPSSNETLQLRR